MHSLEESSAFLREVDMQCICLPWNWHLSCQPNKILLNLWEQSPGKGQVFINASGELINSTKLSLSLQSDSVPTRIHVPLISINLVKHIVGAHLLTGNAEAQLQARLLRLHYFPTLFHSGAKGGLDNSSNENREPHFGGKTELL